MVSVMGDFIIFQFLFNEIKQWISVFYFFISSSLSAGVGECHGRFHHLDEWRAGVVLLKSGWGGNRLQIRLCLFSFRPGSLWRVLLQDSYFHNASLNQEVWLGIGELFGKTLRGCLVQSWLQWTILEMAWCQRKRAWLVEMQRFVVNKKSWST